MFQALAALTGAFLVVAVFWEAFETIVLPRTVSRRVRFTSLFFEFSWRARRSVAHRFRSRPERRDYLLSVFGPLSLLLLMALWSGGVIVGFALMQYGIGTAMSGGETSFGSRLYASAATFFTVGYGDVVAVSGVGRSLAMLEAGMGFGMFALVISYFPVLYQAFSARERVSLLLDARAGSPPVAAELLTCYGSDLESLRSLFEEFERWGASLLETYLSYPVLAIYRSQHEQLSWIASLTCVCDACALVQVAYRAEGKDMDRLHLQAKLTYAMLRHLVVDIAYVMDADPVKDGTDRLGPEGWQRMASQICGSGAPISLGEDACERLTAMRHDYEPYLIGLAEDLQLTVPPWTRMEHQAASWETTAWDGEHF